MANVKITELTALAEAPATDDVLVLVDTSVTTTKKITVANFYSLYVDQAVKTTSSPTYVTVKLSGLTDGYFPKHTDDTTGLVNSLLFQSTNALFWNDTANTFNTTGLTINQAATDDEILSLKSSDVAHTITTDTEADTYGLMKKYSATVGGVLLRGLTDATGTGLALEGIIGATDPTDTDPAILMIGSKQTGTTTAALGDVETVWQLKNRTTNLITVLGNGNISFSGNVFTDIASTRGFGLQGTQLHFDKGSSYYTGYNFPVSATLGLYIDPGGNMLMSVAAVGTSAAKVLGMGEGTPPTTSPADMSQVWSANLNGVAGANRLHERTETGISSPIALQTEVDAAVNGKTPSQAVNMTAAASGSTGLRIPTNTSIYLGTTTPLTTHITFSLIDWTGALSPYPLNSDGISIRLLSTKKLRVYLGAGFVDTTKTISFIDGTVQSVTCVTVRETAAVAGSHNIYLNGNLFETLTIPINASPSTMDVSNFYLLGTGGGERDAGTVRSAYIFNRALTAAEVLDLYRNGVAEADKWGSQTSIITGNDSTFAGASNWANVDINAYDETTGGVLTITASAAGQYCTLPIANATTVSGKKYRLTYTVASLAATWTITDFTGTGQTIGTVSADGTSSIEFTASTTGGLRLVSVATNSSGVFDNFLLTEIGVTLALEPEGIQVDGWKDSTTNGLNASYPTVGSSLVRPVPTDNAERLLSTTTVALNADGDTTIYTVPTGKRCVLTKAILIAGADAASTDISIGQNGAETDWIDTTQCDNLDAANDAIILQPVPAATPVKSKSYAAGTVIQINVANQAGGASNTLYLFGYLY